MSSARQRHHILVSSMPYHDKKLNSPKFVGLFYSICGFMVMLLDRTSLNKSYLCLKHELPINVVFHRSGCRAYLLSCKIVLSCNTILKVEFECFKSHTLHLSLKLDIFEILFGIHFLLYSILFLVVFFSTYIILNLQNYMNTAIVCNVFTGSNLCIIEKH